jgi:glycosyltransferase involved in cell wall biosynthesis
MRVLFVTTAYPASGRDPRGIFIHRLAQGLLAEGITIVVVAPGFPGGPPRHVLDGVDIRRVSYWIPRWQHLATGLGGIVPNLRKRPWLVAQVPPLIGSLARGAIRLAPAVDVIHAHWIYPGGLAGVAARRRSGRPLIVTSHGGDLNLAKGRSAVRSVARRVVRGADACVGVSRSLVDDFLSLGVPPQRVAFIPYGVALAASEGQSNGPTDMRLKEFETYDGFRILYLGSLIPRKSVETLLDGHKELVARGHAVGTMIVGAGPRLERLKSIVRSRSLETVWFVPPQPPSAVVRWMEAADVVVLPSLSEGRPNVILEALAAGRPVVASDIPGTRELVESGRTGFLFPAGSARALADRLEQLMSSPSLRLEMSRRAQEWVVAQGLTTTQVVAAYRALYERVVRDR